MARKATGSLEWRTDSWVGRIRLPDGKRSAWCSLGTDDKKLAKEKLAQWLATGEAPGEAGKELFSDATERVLSRPEAQKEKGYQNRAHRLRTFALPVIGHIAIGVLKAHHIHAVLSRMGEQEKATRAQYAADTVHHLRVDISRILTALVREGSLDVNVAKDVELPDDVEVDDRPRIVLTDEEIVEFRVQRGFERELDMMALFARDLGGHRTSDLHAADYSDFDTRSWQWCMVRRPKTDREGSRKGKRKGRRRATRGYERQKITIPESVRGPLQAWWKKAGKPVSGPVFPLRRGDQVGGRKTGKGISYAKALRFALWEARIYRPLPGFELLVGDARKTKCALQTDTDESRAVDFHSFRRAFVTALANSGLNLQTAMAAAGHADPTTHGRYIQDGVVTVPASALPQKSVTAPLAQQSKQANAAVTAAPGSIEQAVANLVAALRGPIDPRVGSNGVSGEAIDPLIPEQIQQRARKDSNLRPTAPEATAKARKPRKTASGHASRVALNAAEKSSLTRASGQSTDARSALLEAAGKAVSEGNWALADQIRTLLAPPALASVHKLSPVRKR